ncbi:MAG: c-type cytochrome [Candidatus Marinimicrobia bacterium]|nr:c-type cytochrome [Candidatus Neomarinimicrobiota bacterium]
MKNSILTSRKAEVHSMNIRLGFLIVPFLGLILCSLLSITRLESAVNSGRSGETLYQEYCSACHGLQGKGDGELAYLVYPKPRDFSRGIFKIRSTPSGYPPTDGDLFSTIQRGMPGGAMPSFYFLENEEIRSLVDYIKKIGGVENSGVQPISIPDILPPSPALVELGRTVYVEAGCSKCHGDLGKGDGPSSRSLIDTWGYPIIPKDFTSGVYLGGGDVEDLYYRFVGGLGGTPMPSYEDLAESLDRLPDEQDELVWGLIHYIKSLETIDIEKVVHEPQDGVIVATRAKRYKNVEDFLDLSAVAWKKAERYFIPVSRLWQSDRTNYQMLEVQALYNTKYIAVKLSWEDDTPDQGLYRIQDFQDGAALQFSLDGTMGFHGMGSQDHPTDIWYWKAEWQLRQNEQAFADITIAYANRVSDSDVDTYPVLMNDMAYLAGRDAGNIVSAPTISTTVENALAMGPQTLTAREQRSQHVSGRGVWDGNRWHVVFVRKLVNQARNTVRFKPGKSVPIGFAVWNGSEGDRNGQKMVSTWYTLKLKK